MRGFYYCAFMHDSIFETDRVYTREFRPEDLDAVHEYGRLTEVTQYQSWGPNELRDTKEFIKMVLDQQKQLPRRDYEFAVIEKSSNQLIGGCGIRKKSEVFNDADFGYTFHPSRWGQGLGTETTRGLIRFGFERLQLNRIWAIVDTRNLASIRVLEKSGLKREGLQRQGLRSAGRLVDCYLYAILLEDFGSTQ